MSDQYQHACFEFKVNQAMCVIIVQIQINVGHNDYGLTLEPWHCGSKLGGLFLVERFVNSVRGHKSSSWSGKSCWSPTLLIILRAVATCH